jgi:glutathione synthase/RimK-type ligase-like ATP-grasp enzyme
MILLITYQGDPVALAAETMLRARGVPFARFESLTFPECGSLTQRFGPHGSIERRIVVDGNTIDLSALTAVWHRRHRTKGSSEITDARMRKFAQIETEQVLIQTWSDLAVRFLPAPLGVIRAGQEKLRQLRLATALGLEIPATLVTTDPAELLAFHREHDGRLITKLLGSSSMCDAGLSNEYSRFTESVSVRDLAARDCVRVCPVYAQANVPKAFELRITVVGARVFAAEIHSQSARHGRDDWRKAGPAAVLYREHDLPRAIADRCVALVQSLGLTYGAIDMVVRPDGEYVFIEINPAGEYHWVEKRTGLPITAAIVDFLTQPVAVRKSA